MTEEQQKKIAEKNFFFKELAQLKMKGYINSETANLVQAGYQRYLLDSAKAKEAQRQLAIEAEELALAENEEATKARNLKQKEDERRAFLNSLVGKTAEPLNSVSEAELQAEKNGIITNSIPSLAKLSAESKQNNPKTRTLAQQRERNLSLVLCLGVILLLLGGLVLATTSWFSFASVTKVLLILSVSGLFGGMGFVAHKLKIRQTSFAFVSLALLFLPITVISAAYYQLFGPYLSLTGAGREVLGLIVSIGFTFLYYLVAKAYQSRIFKWLTLGLAYCSLLFVALAATITNEAALLVLGGLLLGVTLGYKHGQKLSYIQFFANEWQLYQILILAVSSIWLVNEINNTVLSVVTLFIFSLLFFINGLQNLKYHLAFQLIGNLAAYLGVFLIGVLQTKLSIALLVLIVSLLLTGFSWLTKLKLSQKLPAIFIQQQILISSSVNAVAILLLSSQVTINGQLPIMLDNIALGLGVLLLLTSIYRLVLFKANFITVGSLFLTVYLVLASILRLLGLSSNVTAYGIHVVALVGYCGVFVYSKARAYWLSLAVASVLAFGVAGIFVLESMGSIEQMVWLFALWGVTLLTYLRIHPPYQAFFVWFLPIALPLTATPLMLEIANFIWFYGLVSLAVLGFGLLMKFLKQTQLKENSLVVSAVVYSCSFLVLVVQISTNQAAWSDSLILALGGLISYLLSERITNTLSVIGVVFFVTCIALYPVLLLQLTSLTEIVYIEGLASIYLAASYLLRQKPEFIVKLRKYIKVTSQLLVWGGLLLALVNETFLTEPIIFILPIVIYSWLLGQTPQLIMKRIYLGTMVLFVYFFLVTLGVTLKLSWLDASFSSWLLALGLFAAYYLLKQSRRLTEFVGLGVSSLALILNVPFFNQAANWSQAVISLLLWFFVSVYLKRYLAEKVELILWLGLFVLTAWNLWWLSFAAYAGVLMVLVLSRAVLSFLQKRSLLVMNPLEIDSSLAVTALGYAYLRSLTFIKGEVLIEAGLILCLIVYTFVFFRLEHGKIEKAILATIFYLSLVDLINWGIRYYQSSLYRPMIPALKVTLLLIVSSLLLRKVWQVSKQHLTSEFVFVGLGVAGLMLEALVQGSLAHQLVFSITVLVYLIAGFVLKYKAYFISGLVGISLSLLYNQRHFWSSLPWWFYLIIGGAILILIASSTEWMGRKKEQGKPSLVKRIAKFFAKWN